MKLQILAISGCLLMFFSSLQANAAGGGSHAIGAGIIVGSPNQSDLDGYVDAVNSSAGSSVGKMGGALEFFAQYKYRFSSSMFGLVFRPSYFSQSGGGNGYDTKLTGFTFFPMFRLHPLENKFIAFFMQVGLGYGSLSGTLSQPNGSVDFKGSAFGATGGLGADFSFGSHVITVEGNLRYLPMERNLITKKTGTTTVIDVTGSELERDNADMATTLSGVQGLISYTYQF